MSELSGEGNITKNTHLSCLLVCYPHQVSVIQAIALSVCVAREWPPIQNWWYTNRQCETQLRTEGTEAE